MKIIRTLGFLLSLFLTVGVCRAEECSSVVPESGHKLLADFPGWRIVLLNDLPTDDIGLWNAANRGRCPGVAVGNFVNEYAQSYAIALIRKNPSGKLEEQLLLLAPKGRTLSRLVVVRPTLVVSPFVVWRVPPGKYSGVDKDESVSVEHDSFVYEKIEATATQYYFVNGHLRSLLTAE